MASSTFKFVDQNGNPVWGLATRISRGHGDTTKAEDERYPDRSGKTTFLEVKKVLPAADGHTIHVNYNEGLNPNWADYLPVSKHFDDIEDAGQISQPIVVQRKGATNPNPPSGPINGYGSCSEWKNEVKKIFDKHGFNTVGPDNEGMGAAQAPHLRATIDEIRALYTGPNKHYLQWQYESVGNPPELRPRLFLPHSGSDMFARYADIGDWNGPIKWEHCEG